jgi:aromatic ring-opening dioxygenase LigB subunit
MNKETYSIPVYENGVKTEWTVDGVVGDEKYSKLLELGEGIDLPTIINTTTKNKNMGIKLTYGICVCNEFIEIQRLINFLLKNKRIQDNIVVLFDSKSDKIINNKIHNTYSGC